MLSSNHDRFFWSKQDRLQDVTYFRQLQQHWRPVSRFAFDDEAGRRPAGRSDRIKPGEVPKAAWTPWLWVDR
jgi:hypothetical protein